MIRIAIAATEREPARVVACAGPCVVIGRAAPSDLLLRAAGVSGSHCRLTEMAGVVGAYILEDLGSSYGTAVNGSKVVKPVVVSARDEIAVGGVRVRVVAGDDDAAALRALAAAPVGEAEAARVASDDRNRSAWYDLHARFDPLAQAWHGHGRRRLGLLRGAALREAETWLREGRAHAAALTPIHRDFVMRSRAAARTRLVGVFAAVIGGAAVIAAGALFGPRIVEVLRRGDEPGTAEVVEVVPNVGPGPELGPTPTELRDLDALVERSLQIADPNERLILQGEVVALARGSMFVDPLLLLQRSAHETLEGVRATVLRGHDGPVRAVVWDPHGRWVASGGRDRTALLWDVSRASPTLPQPLHGHTGEITTMAVSRDGHWLVTASEDRTLLRWDVQAPDPGATAVVLRGHDAPIDAVAVAPGGRWATSGDRAGAIVLWDLDAEAPGEPVARRAAHDGPVTDLVFDGSDAVVLSAGDDRTIRRWRVGAGLEPAGRFEGAASGILRVAVPRNGRWVIGAGADGVISLWDRKAREPLALAGHTEAVSDVAITPDDRWLVSASEDDTLRVWDLAAKDPSIASVVLAGHTGDLTRVRITAGGRKVVSAALDNTLRVWDLTKKDLVVDVYPLVGHEGPIADVALDPTGVVAASAGEDGTVRLFDVLGRRGGAGGKVLRGAAGPLADGAIDGRGRRLALVGADGRAELWEPGASARMPAAVVLADAPGARTSVAIDRDGRHAAAGSEAGAITLWSLGAGAPAARVLAGHQRAVHRLAFTPDGARLVSIGSDKTVRVWSSDEGTPPVVLTGHADEVVALALSSDGRLAFTGSVDGGLIRWDLSAADLQASAKALGAQEGGTSGIDVLALSSDGSRLLVGGDDRRARLYDATTGAIVHVLRGHDDALTAASFSPDGTRLATGGRDSRVLVWKLDAAHPDEDPITLAGHEQSVTALAFVDGNDVLASASNDATVRLWIPATGSSLTLRGHDAPIVRLAAAPEPGVLVSVSLDGSARLWPIAPAALATRICEVVGAPADPLLRAALFEDDPPPSALCSASLP